MPRLALLALCLLSAGCSARHDTTANPDDAVTSNTDLQTDNMTDVDTVTPAGGGPASRHDSKRIYPSPRPSPSKLSAYCAAMDAYLSPEDCARLQVQKANLDQGVAAFNPPSAMTVGQAQDITLALGKSDNQAGVDQAVQAGGNDAAPVHFTAKLGRYMTARLIGGGFDIRPLESEQQDLGGGHFGTWRWRVTPKMAGAQTLMLNVEANAMDAHGAPTLIALASKQVSVTVGVSGADRRREDVDAFNGDVNLGVSVLGSVKGLLVALTAVIGAAAALYIAVRRFGRPPKDKSGS